MGGSRNVTGFRAAVMRTVLVMIGIAIALFISELGARMYLNVPRVERIRPQAENTVYQFSANPLLGYTLKESYRHDEPNNHDTFAYTNSHGQRDVERAIAKPAGTHRVIVLGDSVVAGHGMADLNDTISRQMERQYENRGEKVEVLNFGIGGYCTRAEVELLRTRGLQFQPDMVVVVWVANDITNFNDTLQDGRIRKSRPAVLNQLFLKSHLMRYTCLAFDLFHFRQETDDSYDARRNFQAAGPTSNVTIGFRTLRALADQHGFGVLVVVWPIFTDTLPVDEEHPEFEKAPNGEMWVMREALGANLPIRRLVKWYRQDMAAGGFADNARSNYTVGDMMHPSPDGATVAATAIRLLLGDPKRWSNQWQPTRK